MPRVLLRLTRRRVGVAVVVLATVSMAATALLIWWRGRERAEAWLREGGRGARGEYTVDAGSTRRLGSAPTSDDVRTVTAPALARDGATAGDRLLVATAGGLLVYGAPGTQPSLLTHLDGLPAADLGAAGRLGERVLVGDRAGGLVLLDGERATPMRLGLPRPAPVDDIASAGEVVYLLYTGLGVVGFDGRRARDVGAATGFDLTAASAICVGTSGLAVGTRDGAVFVESGGPRPGSPEATAPGAGLERRDFALGGAAVTALGCPGPGMPDLMVGTPFGLRRMVDGRGAAFGPELFVTGVIAAPIGLVVSTFDDGIFILDGDSGRERGHHLAGERVHRIRLLGDRLMAFTRRGTFALTGGRFEPVGPVPAGLRAPEVAALGRDGAGGLWVGAFDGGIDVLDGGLRPVRHLPAAASRARGAADTRNGATVMDARDDQVNAMLYRADTREMLVATVHGVDVFGATGARRLPLDPEVVRAGEGVSSLVPLQAGLALGTSRGLVLLDGARTRLLYGFHGLANNHVYAVAAEGPRVWAGTLAGVSIVDPGLGASGLGAGAAGSTGASTPSRPRVLRSIGAGPRALANAWVTALAVAPEGVYVGTYGGGVQLVRTDGSVEDPSAAAGRFHVNPGAMALDGDTLWVGTLEAGLLAFDRAGRRGESIRRWRRLGRLLPAADASAILVDGDTFFIGTSAGLVRASRRAVETALAPAERITASPVAAPPAPAADADTPPNPSAAGPLPASHDSTPSSSTEGSS